MNEAVLVECAQWLHARNQENIAQGKTLWWQPHVLTIHNPDKSNPRVSIEDAYEVFIELVRRRLSVHVFARENGRVFPAFEIPAGKDDEWKKLISKKGYWELRAKPAILLFAKKSWLVVVFALTVVATNFLAEFTKHHTKEYLITPEKFQEQPQPPNKEGATPKQLSTTPTPTPQNN